MNQNSKFSFDTVYSADSIEWLPQTQPETDSDRGIFVCGTYQLVDPVSGKFILPKDATQDNTGSATEVNSDKALRLGNIQVFEASSLEPYAKHIQTFDTSASLDLKWSPCPLKGKQHVLGQVDAEGYLKLYSWNAQERTLSPRTTIKFDRIDKQDKELLALSLDWSNRREAESTYISVSFSDGTLATATVSLSDDGALLCQEDKRWKAHDFEAWITGIDYWSPNKVYSGGDDSMLKGWDLRLLSDSSEEASPIWTNKSHMMGVCSIMVNPHREHLLATGSYDETLRLFDTRKMRSPISELEVGGGIWRIRWHPTSPTQLVVAAMHNGFHVVYIKSDTQPAITRSCMEHNSLAYGVDWCMTSPHDYVASCSFYDHKLCVW